MTMTTLAELAAKPASIVMTREDFESAIGALEDKLAHYEKAKTQALWQREAAAELRATLARLSVQRGAFV